MTLDRAQVEARLPHRGAMCLIDEVIDWGPQRIVCASANHRSPSHPLRGDDGLGSAIAIEYAAQAMALHVALSVGEAATGADGRLPAGALVSVRNMTLRAGRLDRIDGPLSIEAEIMSGDASNALYSMRVTGDGHEWLTGRAAVVLDRAAFRAGARAPR